MLFPTCLGTFIVAPKQCADASRHGLKEGQASRPRHSTMVAIQPVNDSFESPEEISEDVAGIAGAE